MTGRWKKRRLDSECSHIPTARWISCRGGLRPTQQQVSSMWRISRMRQLSSSTAGVPIWEISGAAGRARVSSWSQRPSTSTTTGSSACWMRDVPSSPAGPRRGTSLTRAAFRHPIGAPALPWLTAGLRSWPRPPTTQGMSNSCWRTGRGSPTRCRSSRTNSGRWRPRADRRRLRPSSRRPRFGPTAGPRCTSPSPPGGGTVAVFVLFNGDPPGVHTRGRFAPQSVSADTTAPVAEATAMVSESCVPPKRMRWNAGAGSSTE